MSQFENQQTPNMEKIGHGHYLIGSNGYIFSHSNNKVNGSYVGFTFTEEDILRFKYDPIHKKLSVHKKGTAEYFEFDIGLEDERLVVCAYIETSGSVELIQ